MAPQIKIRGWSLYEIGGLVFLCHSTKKCQSVAAYVTKTSVICPRCMKLPNKTILAAAALMDPNFGENHTLLHGLLVYQR